MSRPISRDKPNATYQTVVVRNIPKKARGPLKKKLRQLGLGDKEAVDLDSSRILHLLIFDGEVLLQALALTPANEAFIRDQNARLRQMISNPDLDNQFFESLVECRGSEWLDNVLKIKAEIQK